MEVIDYYIHGNMKRINEYMTNVYCSNCKYYKRRFVNCDPVELCTHRYNIIKGNTYYSRHKRYKKTPEQLNSKNNCIFYRKSWFIELTILCFLILLISVLLALYFNI